MTHGIKSLAQDLAKHGRYGDTMVAHINPQEAAMLKAMGGSGTINPTTGLPEFLKLSSFNPVKAISNVVTPAIKAVQNLPGISVLSNAATQAVKPIDQALVGLDKTVGKAIPGGWGTVAAVAGSMAGVPPIYMAGLGALNGSGVTRKGGSFNLKGALMGGAMAYGMAELGEYARGANLTPGVEGAIPGSMPVNASELGDIVSAPQPEMVDVNAGLAGTSPTAPQVTPTPSSSFVPPTIDSTPSLSEIADIRATQPSMLEKAYNAVSAPVEAGIQSLKEAGQAAINPDTYSNALSKGLENTQKTAGGIYDLITDPKAAIAQADKLVASGDIMLSPSKAAAVTAFGGMGLADLQAQQDWLNQQQASGAISNQEYATQMAAIDAARSKANEAMQSSPYQFGNTTATNAKDAMNENPYKFAAGGEVKGYFGGGILRQIMENPELRSQLLSSTGSSTNPINITAAQTPQSSAYDAIRANPYMYAAGGNVLMNPPDDQTGMENQSPMQNLDRGGIASMIGNTVPQQMFAEGGMPRFLSGGGDGLSDDIPAIIGDKQPAKLADGEFVVSSDVVSGLGGGSSKAGAKKLYEMMDRVRKQAHGTKKQIRPVNTKALPA